MKTLIVSSIKAFKDETDSSVIEKKLNSLIKEIVFFIQNSLEIQPIKKIKTTSIKSSEMELGLKLGVERYKSEIRIPDWAINYETRRLHYFLYFIITKESILHFLKEINGDIEEGFINILTILWLKKIFKIRSTDNVMIKLFRNKVFNQSIGGINVGYFRVYIDHLILKKKTFSDFYRKYKQATENERLSGKELYKELTKWLHSFFSEFDTIAPFQVNEKLHSIIASMIKLGYENNTVQTIADQLSVHPNTIRRNFRILMNNFNVSWRAFINLDRLKLHRYFLKIVFHNEMNFDELKRIIWDRLPYNDRMFLGELETSERILFCPSVFCPHIVTERLNNQLTKLLKRGDIIDYNLREIRERIHTGTFTTEKINLTLDYFKKILYTDIKQLDNLKTHTFSHIKEDLSLEIGNKTDYLDYNLLFFLSKLRGRPLLKSGLIMYTSQLPDFFKLNNISLTDTISQNDFLNQIEIRAIRRGLLTYNFAITRKYLLNSDSTIFEIPYFTKQDEERLGTVMKQLQKFSILGKIVLSDRVIGFITGISYKHPLSKIIRDILLKNEFNPIFYTVKIEKSRAYDYYDLYDYEEKKWLMELKV